MSNTNNFEPPRARALEAYVAQYDKETDPRWHAVKAADLRVAKAEKAATLKGEFGDVCTSGRLDLDV